MKELIWEKLEKNKLMATAIRVGTGSSWDVTIKYILETKIKDDIVWDSVYLKVSPYDITTHLLTSERPNSGKNLAMEYAENHYKVTMLSNLGRTADEIAKIQKLSDGE
jgi:hypothetical protein